MTLRAEGRWTRGQTPGRLEAFRALERKQAFSGVSGRDNFNFSCVLQYDHSRFDVAQAPGTRGQWIFLRPADPTKKSSALLRPATYPTSQVVSITSEFVQPSPKISITNHQPTRHHYASPATRPFCNLITLPTPTPEPSSLSFLSSSCSSSDSPAAHVRTRTSTTIPTARAKSTLSTIHLASQLLSTTPSPASRPRHCRPTTTRSRPACTVLHNHPRTPTYSNSSSNNNSSSRGRSAMESAAIRARARCPWIRPL